VVLCLRGKRQGGKGGLRMVGTTGSRRPIDPIFTTKKPEGKRPTGDTRLRRKKAPGPLRSREQWGKRASERKTRKTVGTINA